MATYSSILVWKIPWTKEPGRLQTTGYKHVHVCNLFYIVILYTSCYFSLSNTLGTPFDVNLYVTVYSFLVLFQKLCTRL